MKHDHRKKPRRPMDYQAWLQIGDNGARQPCSLSDVSEGGARLKVADAATVAAEVKLLVSETSEGRACRVMWRSDTEIGLRFEEPATAKISLLRRR